MYLAWLPIMWLNSEYGCFIRNKYGVGKWYCFAWNEI